MQPIDIKITSCKNPKLWYKDRVGQTYPATIVNGNAFVNGNAMFKVSQPDYDVLPTHINQKSTQYAQVLSLFDNYDLTSGEVFDKLPQIKYIHIRRIVPALKRAGLLEMTGEKRKWRNGQMLSVYSKPLISKDDIPPSVGGGYSKHKTGKATLQP